MTIVEMACKGKLEAGAPVYVDNDGYATDNGDYVIGYVCGESGSSDTATISVGTSGNHWDHSHDIEWTCLPLASDNNILVSDGADVRWEPLVPEIVPCVWCGRVWQQGARSWDGVTCWDGWQGCGASLLE